MGELEREFQGWVLDVAKRGGWRVWHSPMPVRPIGGNKFIPDPRGKGLPDLWLIHGSPPRFYMAEIKSESGTVSEAQDEFLALVRAVADETDGIYYDDAGAIVTYKPMRAFVWRPAHRALIEHLLLGEVKP